MAKPGGKRADKKNNMSKLPQFDRTEGNTGLQMFKHTDNHPDREAAPCTNVQLHHEVDVDKNAEQGQPWKQRDLEKTEITFRNCSVQHYKWNKHTKKQISDLEGQSLIALWLPPYDDNADDTEQSQDDAGHHNGCMSDEQLVQTVCQDDAQNGDENSCENRRKKTNSDPAGHDSNK